jgi:hypothetical protein
MKESGMKSSVSRRTLLGHCGTSVGIIAVCSLPVVGQLPTDSGDRTGQKTTAAATLQATEVAEDIDFDEYSNDEMGYSIQYPEGWAINEADPAGVIIYSQDQLMGITVTEIDSDLSEEDVLELLRYIASTLVGSGEVINEDEITIESGQEAVVEDQQLESDELDNAIILRSAFVIEETTAYFVFIAIAEAQYSEHADGALSEIVESLSIES